MSAADSGQRSVQGMLGTQCATQGCLSNANERDLIYEVDDNYQVLWTYSIKDSTNVYNITRVDGEYIYYVDGDILHRRNYNTGDIENLEIELKDYWNFHVDGNNVVYNVLFDLYHVDLTTKKETKLTITTDNQEALINGIVYFLDTIIIINFKKIFTEIR